MEQFVPHSQHQRLIARREFSGLNGFFQAASHFFVNCVGRVIVTCLQLGYGKRQVTTQITAGEQLIITGVFHHVIN